MKLHAYAKLNLSLRIESRQADGFHNIHSCVQTIDLHDTLTVEEKGEGVVLENDAGIPPTDDLILKAIKLILMAKKCEKGLHVVVKKQIPIGAGLGGGSSDAAAALWAADRLTPPLLVPEALTQLAAALGADVPLFLTGGRLSLRGKGDVVLPSPTRSQETYLLLVPPVRCSTASVYAHFDRLQNSPAPTDDTLGENDLETAALELYPALLPYRDAVKSLTASYAGMTGSGAAFYAVFPDHDPASVARDKLTEIFPKTRLYLCRGTDSGFRVIEEDNGADRH